MSRSISQKEVPRDTHVVHALRRELRRNSQRITQTFWQEFEQIRNRQRAQLTEERNERERIAALMRDANLETQQQAEAISRSISSHGVNPLAPSPKMRPDPKSAKPTTEQIMQELKKLGLKRPKPARTEAVKPLIEVKSKSSEKLEKPPSTSAKLPRSPTSSRAAISANLRTPLKSTPTTSNLQLASKPK